MEDAGAFDVGAVFEVELFRLKVVLVQGLRDEGDARLVLGKGQVGEDVFLLVLAEVPEDDDSVREDKHLAKILCVGDQAIDGADGHLARILAAVGGRRVVQRRRDTAHVLQYRRVAGTIAKAVRSVRILVPETFVFVSALAPLDLEVKHRLPRAWRLQNGPTPQPVAVNARHQRQVVYGIKTVVVELCLCFVLGPQELGRRLDFVRLGSAVCRQPGHLLSPLHFWQPFCVGLPADPASFPQHV